MKGGSPVKLVLTEDGSHSLFIPELDETYHSVHGAIQESQHVYIEAGLKFLLEKSAQTNSLRLLEFGFGTGLNAILTFLAMPEIIEIVYHSIEKFPLPEAIIQSLNYGDVLNNQKLFTDMHAAAWENEVAITGDFKLKKIKTDFRDFNTKLKYDLIYFDAFAPSKQPELWSKKVFEKCYTLLAEGGALVTYSAKGQLKRDLKAIGFRVESLPGPPGKFEITRAIKQ